MEIILLLASDEHIEESATGRMRVKVNAPRRRAFRRGTGGAKWKALQRKQAMRYRRNKAEVKLKGKLYRKNNKVKLKARKKFLKRLPKKQARPRR